jgi:hypothetical protein
MDIAEKAETTRDVVRVGESVDSRYRLQDTELTEAAAIGGSESFPRYGEFLDVVLVDTDGAALGPRWLECPGDLARQLVELEVGVGDTFAVDGADKTSDGAWSVLVAAEVTDG